jgi:hypothetical protein
LNYWLMKSEPDEFSIDDLVKAPKKSTPWFGVRNYQARNFMRDHMRVGDGVLFYHFDLSRARHRRHRRSRELGVSRRDAVRPEERVLRCGIET